MKQRYQILAALLLFVLSSLTALAQRNVTGTVNDPEGKGMPGVNVIVKGTSTGTTTDTNGLYTISMNEGATTLIYSFIGYASQEIEVGTRTTVDVSMVEDVSQLSEVVVTALGIQRNVKALQYSVTQVSGDNFTQARENNLSNSLAGRVAGVNVTKVASGPAASSRVVIRGAKSLQGNNQPLYVVDGIPMDNNNFGQAGVWGGVDEGDGMASISPDDIESITVLKGGSAAALYGSRATNGVINITTKKGSANKGLGIEFNSNYVVETVNDLSDWQQSNGSGAMVGATLATRVATKSSTLADLSAAWNGGWFTQAWGPKFDGSDVVQFDGVTREYSNQGDNYKRYYETGQSWTNSLSFTGGTETQNFRFSVANLNSTGIIPNSGYDRLNMSLATNAKFGKKVTIGAKVLYSHEEVKNRPNVSDSPGNGVQSMYLTPGDLNIDNMKGDPEKLGAVPSLADQTANGLVIFDGKAPGEEFQRSSNLWGQNPWWSAYQFRNSDVRDRIIASGQMRYDITEFLYVQGRAGMDWYTRRDTNLTPQGTGYQRGGSMSEGEDRVRETNLEYILGFDKAFGKINVNAFFGGNLMRRSSERISANGNGFNVPFFAAINNARDRNYGYAFNESGINSLFGSAEISYNGYLFLTATARNDWFSVLNPEVNDILYPSVGASFVFTDAFETLPSVLSFGKIRASWAEVGSATIGAYATNNTYSLGNPHLGRPLATFSSAGGFSGNLPNPVLQPATSTEFEFGFDVRFFDNRLGIDFTYYNQATTDDILNAQISRASGFGSTSVNIGKMTNKGIEILLTGTPVRGALTWDVSLNFAKNNNNVESLIAGNTELNVEEPRTRTVFVKHIVGYPYGMLTGLVQQQSPDGQLVYDATTGAPIQSQNYQIIGYGVPDFTGGLNNSLSYKQFNLSFLIDFKSGGDIYSGTNVRMTGAGFHQQTLIGREGEAELVRSGVSANADGSFAAFSKTYTPGEAQNYWSLLSGRAQENFVQDASFAKLRQVTFGYSLPKSILAKTPIRTLTLSFVGRNLAILFKNVDNIDPESSYSSGNGQGLDYFGVPSTRSYGFNLKATF
jgi:TonB-linked SusC/RagA family outer membrane protein